MGKDPAGMSFLNQSYDLWLGFWDQTILFSFRRKPGFFGEWWYIKGFFKPSKIQMKWSSLNYIYLLNGLKWGCVFYNSTFKNKIKIQASKAGFFQGKWSAWPVPDAHVLYIYTFTSFIVVSKGNWTLWTWPEIWICLYLGRHNFRIVSSGKSSHMPRHHR